MSKSLSIFILRHLFLLFPFSLFSQNTTLSDTTKPVQVLNEVVVLSTMASARAPFSFTNISKQTLSKLNFGQDIPYLLRTLPSVVETSDAGNGVGYTALRVRGTDPTRINITLDGVPVNDSESQLVYWVNMPDLASSTALIQMQRGVGTSTNGAGAFGASINVVTDGLEAQPYARYSGSFGSFQTQKHTISAGSGLLKGKFAFDLRASLLGSEGYVERAASDLKSVFASALYVSDKSSLRLRLMSGKEKTYQAWYGVPESYADTDSLRRVNFAGTEKATPYENQTDNYTQTHAHLNFKHLFSPYFSTDLTAHYTRGGGYYEEYKALQDLKSYGFRVINPQADSADLVRQLWLKNHFGGLVFSGKYNRRKVDWVTGGGINRYWGLHFGDVTQVFLTEKLNKSRAYFYENQSIKTDFNVFTKLGYSFTEQFVGFLDLQYRYVAHDTKGDKRTGFALVEVTQNADFQFFNPKIGLTFLPSKADKLYASFAIGNKEPNRNDLIDRIRVDASQPEQLLNTELGYERKIARDGFLKLNFYHMFYNNQLISTGSLNEVGETIRTNVANSYRTGLEFEGLYPVAQYLSFAANLTLSRSAVIKFTEKAYDYATSQEVVNTFENTPIAFSPQVVSNVGLNFSLLNSKKQTLGGNVSWKYVGKQYLDNSGRAASALAAYQTLDFRFDYQLQLKGVKNLSFKFLVNNCLNARYSSNGSTYPIYNSGVLELNKYVFPQAGTNFMVGFDLGF
jgi:iron complex outermembrane recepter protein